jgi:hypothetical protein
MKIINEYLIIDPITGEIDKYVELEGEVFFRVSIETNNIKYYWIPTNSFYERYDSTKKQLKDGK